jgi:hypothetical protein
MQYAMGEVVAPAEAQADTIAPLQAVPTADTVGASQPAGGEPPPPIVEPGAGEPTIERPVLGAELAPPPSVADQPTIFAQRGRRRDIFSGRTGGSDYRSVGPGTFYGSGFLTEGDVLPWAAVTGAAGKATLGSLTEVSSARIFESVEIQVPAGASYHIGDSLLMAVEGREVPGWGRVIVPTGLARVREVSGTRVVADVLSQWSRVSSGQVAMPVEPFRSPGTVPPVTVENGLTGQVVTMREINPIAGARQVVFIDRGRDDGVSLGDEFEVLRPNPPTASPETPLQQVAVIQIVHVRQRSASGLLTRIVDLGVGPGVPVRLIRKMPS